MARYGRDFGESRGGQWNRGQRDRYRGGEYGWDQAGGDDSAFGYGARPRGESFGRGYGDQDFERGRFDRGRFGGGYGGKGFGRGDYGGGYGGRDYQENRFGGYGSSREGGRGGGFKDRDRWGGGYAGGGGGRQRPMGGGMYGRGQPQREQYDRDLGDRLREGWNDLRRGFRENFGGGYDRRW